MDMKTPKYPTDREFAVVMTSDEALAIKDAITIANLVRDGHLDEAKELVDPGEYDYFEHHVAYGLRTLEPKIDKAMEPLYRQVRQWMDRVGIRLDGR